MYLSMLQSLRFEEVHGPLKALVKTFLWLWGSIMLPLTARSAKFGAID